MYQLISDGGCDFSESEVKEHNITIVPFYISFDQENYLMEGRDITKDEYFDRLVSEKKLFPKTSQPSPQDYIDKFQPFLEAGQDIILLTISSKLSGSYASAVIASDMLREDFPDRTIAMIDSLNVSVGQGLILREMIKMRDAGFSLEDNVRITEQVRGSAKVYFTLTTLEYLKKGGRVGPTTALVGGILGLSPILQVEDDGSVAQLDNVRGRKVALKLIEEAMVHALKDEVQNIEISIGQIQREDEAATFKKSAEAALDTEISNPITCIGVTIGTHAGPGALAFGYCRKFNAFENENEAVEKYGVACLVGATDLTGDARKAEGAA